MANNGFSAPVNYWGTIAGLTPKSSSDGKTSQTAEAVNSYGDVVAHDEYGELLAPSTEYVVTGTVNLSAIILGSVHTLGEGAGAKKLMLTNLTINTQAGTPPTVTISGVEVESGATAARTYALTGTLTPRSKAQDVCGALTASDNFTSITTTASVNPQTATVTGVPVASDAANGRIEVNATLTDPTGTGTITAATGGGFAITSAATTDNPDADYVTHTATATKFLAGTEAGQANS